MFDTVEEMQEWYCRWECPYKRDKYDSEPYIMVKVDCVHSYVCNECEYECDVEDDGEAEIFPCKYCQVKNFIREFRNRLKVI